MRKRVAIFASGGGSNAESIIRHFKESDVADIALIVSNKSDALVLERAKRNQIPFCVQPKRDGESKFLLSILRAFKIDFIVLAGYLKKIHPMIVTAFPSKIVNIHPALLPKFGGKGMYGMHVHHAVQASGVLKTGMTIHYVNEHYDEGNIIAQFECAVSPNDTAETIQKNVLSLEHKHYPEVIEKILAE